MNFVNSNDIQTSGISSIHYVLMLDRSGSMSGQEWNDLLKAVEGFLTQLEQSEDLKQNSKITIIAYDSSEEIICDCVEPSSYLLRQLKFTGGGTDFDKPLQLAYQKIQQYLNRFDQHVLCMMSDGQSSYPSNAIQNFKQNSNMMNKLKFSAYGYGESDFEQLKNMAIELGGKMDKTIKPEILKTLFLQLIPNIYK